MTASIRILSFGALVFLTTGATAFGQVPERLAPAAPHGPRVGPTPPTGAPRLLGPSGTRPTPPRPTPPRTNPPRWNPPGTPWPPPNPGAALLRRLGLDPGERAASGRVYHVFQNGARGRILGNYVVTADGRVMMFPVATNYRLDFFYAVYNPSTNVVGTKFSGLNLTTARNTGGGGTNFNLNGTGPVLAQMQTWYEMIGTQVHQVPSQTQLTVWVPN